jgi:hypothetical protein
LVFLCRSNRVEQRLQLQAIKVSTQFQITKHLKLVVLLQRAKFLCGCFEFEVLKVGLAPQRAGDLLIPPVRGFQITKHLKLADLAQRAKFLGGCFKFKALKVELAPQRMGDLLIPLGPQVQITKHLI